MDINKKKEIKKECNGYYKTVIRFINKSLRARMNHQTIEIVKNIKSGGPKAHIEYFFNNIIPSLHSDYENLWEIKTDKRFAEAVRSNPLNGAMFARRKGKIKGFDELGKVISANKLLEYMKMKHNNEFEKLISKIERRQSNDG